MKILIATITDDVQGGGEISAALLSRALQRRGHQVRTLPASNLPIPQHGRGFKTRILGALEQQRQPEEILHLYHTAFLPALAQGQPTRSIITLNNLPPWRLLSESTITKKPGARLHNRSIRQALQRIELIHTLSEHMKETYRAAGCKGSITVIPNMIDDAWLSRPHPEPKRPVILFVGMLYRHKGVDIVVRAMKHISADLIVIGDGPERRRLTTLAQGLPVAFLGKLPHSEINAAIDRCTLMVAPARWDEPFGRSVIEGMARRRVVLVSDKGEPPRLVGNPSLIVKGSTPSAWAKAITDILDDDAGRKKMASDLRDRAFAFEERKIVARFESLYSTLLE